MSAENALIDLRGLCVTEVKEVHDGQVFTVIQSVSDFLSRYCHLYYLLTDLDSCRVVN